MFVADNQPRINSEARALAGCSHAEWFFPNLVILRGVWQIKHTKAVILHVSGNSIEVWRNNKKPKTKLKPPDSSAMFLGVRWDILALWAEKSPTNITGHFTQPKHSQMPALGGDWTEVYHYRCILGHQHTPPPSHSGMSHAKISPKKA